MQHKHTILDQLVGAFREELLESGEFLARCHEATGVEFEHGLRPLTSLRRQQEVINECRTKRERAQWEFAKVWQLPASAAPNEWVQLVPDPYRHLIEALLQENQDLQSRIFGITEGGLKRTRVSGLSLESDSHCHRPDETPLIFG